MKRIVFGLGALEVNSNAVNLVACHAVSWRCFRVMINLTYWWRMPWCEGLDIAANRMYIYLSGSNWVYG